MKIKIIIVLFVMMLTGFLLYFIISKINKERTKEEKQNIITESFENYDIRKFILNELDTYTMTKKDKNIIYESLSKRVDELKNMPQDKIQSLIKEIVHDSKSLQSLLNENNENITEDYEDELDDDEISLNQGIEPFENEDIQKIKDIVDNIDKIIASLNVSTDNITNIKKELRDYVTNKRASSINTTATNASKKVNVIPPNNANANKNQLSQPAKQPLRSTEMRRNTFSTSNKKRVKPMTQNKSNESTKQDERILQTNTNNTTNSGVSISNQNNDDTEFEEFSNPSIEGFKNYGGEWFSYI